MLVCSVMFFLNCLFNRDGNFREFVNISAVLLFITFGCLSSACSGEIVRILAFGDSLIAGYGLRIESTFSKQLELALKKRGITAKVINAGVSGDTTAGGLSRFDWSIKESIDAIIIELGANDGLRGIEPSETFKNLNAILDKSVEHRLAVLLAGMRAPPNLGKDYGKEYSKIYPNLAKKHDVILYPFFLEGVVNNTKLNQKDAIHPNAKGIKVIVKNILPYVMDLIEKVNSNKD